MILSMVAVAGILGQGDATVIGALLASLAAVGVAWFQGRRAAGAATTAAQMISTNHGTRPGEYLEMIGQIHTEVALLRGEVGAVVAAINDHEHRWHGSPRSQETLAGK
jgi:hypothetical protein